MKTSKIISGLLALLGFSGCGDGDKVMYGPPDVLMYGPMQVSFVVKGAVTDADEKPLENIRVVLKIKDDEPVEGRYDRRVYRDTVYTDSKGEFRTDPRPDVPMPLELIAADIDGEDNGGGFEGEEKEFTVSKGNWDGDEGVYVNEINFTLNEKEESNESE